MEDYQDGDEAIDIQDADKISKEYNESSEFLKPETYKSILNIIRLKTREIVQMQNSSWYSKYMTNDGNEAVF